MPLTKLARRYHENRENVLATPSVRQKPQSQTPSDLPPYVTVRKHKRRNDSASPQHNAHHALKALDFSLNSTVAIEGHQHESINSPKTDCKHFQRLESTHINHIFEKFGQLSLSTWTEDISAINEPELDNEQDDSFKTAVEDHKIVLAEDSTAEETSTSDIMASKDPRNQSACLPSRIAHWVLHSPFQSPCISSDTIVISESDEDDTDDDGGVELALPVAETIDVTDDDSGSSRLQKASFIDDSSVTKTTTSCSSSEKNPICDEEIADVWCLTEEGDLDKSLPVTFSPSSSIPNCQASNESNDNEIGTRSVCLQVSLDHSYCSGEEEGDVKEETKDIGQEKNTLSLASEVNSQGNALFLEDTSSSVARSEDEGSSIEDPAEHLSFLTSLSLELPNDEKKCHPDAIKYLKNYDRHKEELLQRLFALFNRKAFKSALPKDLVFAWNPRLTKTAGVCINRKIRIDNEREERISKIELSSKVIGNARLILTFKKDSFLNSTY